MQLEKLNQRLHRFQKKVKAKSKGSLSVLLTLTRIASNMKFPLSPDDFRTGNKGQVTGLGGGAVKSILKDYGIFRTLAEEGGRTSRGSMGLMESYVRYLNELHDNNLIDFAYIESWWIDRIKDYFASQPIHVKADVSKSLRQIVLDLLDAALERQRECTGTMVAGAVLEHLVGAKLSIALKDCNINHKNFSAADEPTNSKGDFLVNDTAIHVTVAPSNALVRKCKHNLDEGLRPLVITTEKGIGGISALAENENIANRIDVLEVAQFVTTNIYEWIGFDNQDRKVTLEKLIDRYNEIIDTCESDPSFKIALK